MKEVANLDQQEQQEKQVKLVQLAKLAKLAKLVELEQLDKLEHLRLNQMEIKRGDYRGISLPRWYTLRRMKEEMGCEIKSLILS